MRATLRNALACLGLLLLCGGVSVRAWSAGEPIGAARVIVAEVSALGDAETRRLVVDDPVAFRELISTSTQSAAVFALRDGTEVAMGENAQLRLDEFVYDSGAAARLSLSLDFGALRFATGTMPKPAYAIRTPRASLAVRGTVFDLAVGADGATYIAVSEGAVTVSTAAGQSVDVTAGQSVSIDAAGFADMPRPTAVAPLGALPAKLAAMDLSLAEHIADLDASALADLEVLGPSRQVAQGLGDGELGDRPDIDLGQNRPDRTKPDKDRIGRDKDRPGRN